ncbi:CU044_2847 family protein [Streptomyces sp. NPDC048278]|uniref:CU044_2847 family protein n=1 Tax=Streptomyces sp. NPDC048278 TaxID=3155809 RepID=UPI003415351E
MDQDATRIVRVRLPDGTPVWARISGAGELAVPSGELSFTDTGLAERVEASVESLHSLVAGVARSLAEPLHAVRPDEVSVEFGIELTAKAGKVVGLLADGEAKAALTVTLTWKEGGPPDPDDGRRVGHGGRAGRGGSPAPEPASEPARATRAGASGGAPVHRGVQGAGAGGTE